MNRPAAHVRPGVLDDAPRIAALESASFGADAWQLAAVTAELCTANRRIAVAEVEACLVGYVDVSVVAEVADLTRVAVAPTARRRGVGAALLAWAVAQAQMAGAERLMLEVAASNVAAIGLYASTGFAEIARRPGYYGAERDALVLQRALRLGE